MHVSGFGLWLGFFRPACVWEVPQVSRDLRVQLQHTATANSSQGPGAWLCRSSGGHHCWCQHFSHLQQIWQDCLHRDVWGEKRWGFHGDTCQDSIVSLDVPEREGCLVDCLPLFHWNVLTEVSCKEFLLLFSSSFLLIHETFWIPCALRY